MTCLQKSWISLWNSLPEDIKKTKTVSCFKTKLKTYPFTLLIVVISCTWSDRVVGLFLFLLCMFDNYCKAHWAVEMRHIRMYRLHYYKNSYQPVSFRSWMRNSSLNIVVLSTFSESEHFFHPRQRRVNFDRSSVHIHLQPVQRKSNRVQSMTKKSVSRSGYVSVEILSGR